MPKWRLQTLIQLDFGGPQSHTPLLSRSVTSNVDYRGPLFELSSHRTCPFIRLGVCRDSTGPRVEWWMVMRSRPVGPVYKTEACKSSSNSPHSVKQCTRNTSSRVGWRCLIATDLFTSEYSYLGHWKGRTFAITPECGMVQWKPIHRMLACLQSRNQASYSNDYLTENNEHQFICQIP